MYSSSSYCFVSWYLIGHKLQCSPFRATCIVSSKKREFMHFSHSGQCDLFVLRQDKMFIDYSSSSSSAISSSIKSVAQFVPCHGPVLEVKSIYYTGCPECMTIDLWRKTETMHGCVCHKTVSRNTEKSNYNMHVFDVLSYVNFNCQHNVTFGSATCIDFFWLG